MPNSDTIANWCKDVKLPPSEVFFEQFLEETGIFTDLEGIWDFKREWPFSYSDDYFYGICRLLCAFLNSQGGIIIFGVDDATREGSKNPVRPNVDKLISAFEQITGHKISLDTRTYEHEQAGIVQAVIIGRRPAGTSPVRFQKKCGKYKQDIYWIRDGHEVIVANPNHYASLFIESFPTGEINELGGYLPPSSASIKNFVGRISVLDALFDWISNSDEPRTYLYGKGGSGKTTIAHEFAKLIKSFGENLYIEGADQPDQVIFLSAKERELDPNSGRIQSIDSPDFYDEESLLKSILLLGEWVTDEEYLEKLNKNALRDEISNFFNTVSCLVVLDDLDTLTTRGIDPGSDFLYRTLVRSQRRSKVLYTLRNAPTQSLFNSIEVPGLTGDDYYTFIERCVSKFKAIKPDSEFIENRLPEISDRRPLIIENIIALTRTCGSYAEADRLFTQSVGEEIRSYVFEREWDALAGSERSCLLLAALSEYKKPASFEELKIFLQAGDSPTKDAVGAVREMFLTVDDTGSQSMYSLAPLTRSFIQSRAEALRFFGKVREIVRNYKRNVRQMPAGVAQVISQLRKHLPTHAHGRSDVSLLEAYRLVSDQRLGDQITNDVFFKEYYGYVLALQPKPNITMMREAFNYCLDLGHEPKFFHLVTWYDIEKNNPSVDNFCVRIADFVIAGKSYSSEDKVQMISRKATYLYKLAFSIRFDDPEQARDLFLSSLKSHLRAFKANASSGSNYLELSEKHAKGSARAFLDICFTSNEPWHAFSAIGTLTDNKDIYFDPIELPILERIFKIEESNFPRSSRSRLSNALSSAINTVSDENLWMDKSRLTYIIPRMKVAARNLRNAT